MSRLTPLFTGLAATAATLSVLAMPGETRVGPVPSPPETVGPNPVIKPVDRHLLPTVQVAVAKGWPAGAKPKAPAGVTVTPFATGLHHPRWLYVLPNGDVLVAETNTPPKPDSARGIAGAVIKHVMDKAGAGAATAATAVRAGSRRDIATPDGRAASQRSCRPANDAPAASTPACAASRTRCG